MVAVPEKPSGVLGSPKGSWHGFGAPAGQSAGRVATLESFIVSGGMSAQPDNRRRIDATHTAVVLPFQRPIRQYPDHGTPSCGCGCSQVWSDKHHMWLCPHCDLQQTGKGEGR